MSSPPPTSSSDPSSPPPSNAASPSSPPPSNGTSSPTPPTPSTTNSTSLPSPTTNSSSPVAPSPESTSVPDSPPPHNGGLPPGALAGLIVGIALGAIIVLICVGVFVIFRRRKRRKLAEKFHGGGPPEVPKVDPQHWQPNAPQHMISPKPAPTSGDTHPYTVPSSTSSSLGSEKPSQPVSSLAMAIGFQKNTFTYEELALATNNFSDTNLIGQGGFGYVHKGVLPDGKLVAVKQLKPGSGQGEREFQAEVEIISRLHHRHLVSLVGYCITGQKRLLVYEFVPNNNLEFHMHGKDRPIMNWSSRMRIALGAAKGLSYLHEDCQPKIIHRDIKASNILIDNSFEAKIADLGLAKYYFETDTHVSTRIMGTFGYLAPEYASTGKLTEKSDVFSFGVVLLELITGKRPVDSQAFLDDSIVDWARPLLSQALQTRNFDAIVDPKLQKDYNSTEMARMVACAAACVRHSARRRPHMNQIVRALEGNMSFDDLNDGLVPGDSGIYTSFESSDYSSMQYKEDLKKFRKMALESQELVSSEYSAPTSDYGMNPYSSSTEGQQTTQEIETPNVHKETVEIMRGS